MKNVFDSHAQATASSTQSPQKTEQPESILDDVMEIFSMILHKGYKHAPTALSYEANEDQGIDIRFRHSAALHIEDHNEALKQNKPFFEDMREFLLQLDTPETRLDIYPGVLTLHADNMLDLVDALSLYFNREDCALKISDTAKPDMSDQRALVEYARSLSTDNKEAYEYYLDSIPARSFASIDHVNATIAARALCDIPVSLDMLRRKITGVETKELRLSAGEHRIMLEDSFSTCAAWDYEPPQRPCVESSPFLLQREQHLQLANAVNSLLISHYGLAFEITRGRISISINGVDWPVYDMRFGCRGHTDSKVYGRYYGKFQKFADDFEKVAEGLCSVSMIASEHKGLIAIRYSADNLQAALTKMVVEQYPQNLMAHAHLRSAAQIAERIDIQLPVNALH